MSDDDDAERMRRWRLALGGAPEPGGGDRTEDDVDEERGDLVMPTAAVLLGRADQPAGLAGVTRHE